MALGACSHCGDLTRQLWTWKQKPDLTDLHTGNWITLKKCPECASLWCEVPYEPYASFAFLARWPYDESMWHQLQGQEGTILHAWHAAMICEWWKTLPDQERDFVDAWRERTYFNHNPIDCGPSWAPSVHLQHPSEIVKYLRE